jgi:hypothetical protein
MVQGFFHITKILIISYADNFDPDRVIDPDGVVDPVRVVNCGGNDISNKFALN